MNKIKILLSQARFAIGCFTNKYREYLTILTALAIVLCSPWALRKVDETAAVADLGYLSSIAMAVVAVLTFLFVTWVFIKKMWPVFSHYSNTNFEDDFLDLSPCKKIAIYLGFYLVVFVSFIAALVAFV